MAIFQVAGCPSAFPRANSVSFPGHEDWSCLWCPSVSRVADLHGGIFWLGAGRCWPQGMAHLFCRTQVLALLRNSGSGCVWILSHLVEQIWAEIQLGSWLAVEEVWVQQFIPQIAPNASGGSTDGGETWDAIGKRVFFFFFFPFLRLRQSLGFPFWGHISLLHN